MDTKKIRYRWHMTDLGLSSDATRARTRAAIVDAAARLLRTEGPDAVTTRAVAAEADVQAPTIYRIFGDKDGLLDAVAEHVFSTYVAGKTRVEHSEDAVADLRAGWDLHIEFGLANPALFALLADPRRRTRSPAAAAGEDVLRGRVRRVAASGRLRVGEQRAVDLIHAAGTGTILTLLSAPAEHRDLGLADTAYEAVLRAIITNAPDAPAGNTTAAAVALRSDLPNLTVLSEAEAALFAEWLDRIINR